MLHTRKPMTDEAVAAMAARNEQRRMIAKRALGDKLITHPSNHIRHRNKKPTIKLTGDFKITYMSPDIRAFCGG